MSQQITTYFNPINHTNIINYSTTSTKSNIPNIIASGSVKNKILNFEMGNPDEAIDDTSVPLPRDLKLDIDVDQMTDNLLMPSPDNNKASCLELRLGTSGPSVDVCYPDVTDEDLKRNQIN